MGGRNCANLGTRNLRSQTNKGKFILQYKFDRDLLHSDDCFYIGIIMCKRRRDNAKTSDKSEESVVGRGTGINR
jgi:hypothetical protein